MRTKRMSTLRTVLAICASVAAGGATCVAGVLAESATDGLAANAPATAPAERQVSPGPEPKPADLSRSIRRQRARATLVPIEMILDNGWLDARPGMTIVDIGAGAGHFSFAMAERMDGEGRVFATDPLPDRIAHMAEEARELGVSIIEPVQVGTEGLDPFYRKHRYDLIFMSNVFHRIDDREPGNRRRYFAALREQIQADGRLAIILYRHVPPVTEANFADIDAAIRDVAERRDYDPFYWGMSAAARRRWDRLGGSPGAEVPPALRSLFIEEINRAMERPDLYRYFFGEKSFHRYDSRRTKPELARFFLPAERDFANWLLLELRENGAIRKAPEKLSPKEARAVRKLNSLFFRSRFRQHLSAPSARKKGVYRPKGDINRQTSKFLVMREVGEAGFELTAEHDVSTYFTLLVFAPR